MKDAYRFFLRHRQTGEMRPFLSEGSRAAALKRMKKPRVWLKLRGSTADASKDL